jgi:hypothetical protein
MANKKINQLVSKTAILSTDLFGIGDATTGQLFKKTIAELQAAIGGAVISVNGLVGTVVLDTDDIQELATPTNKYFTDARARAAISLTVTGNSGASTYSSGTGVLNVPTYTLAGLGGITASFLSGTSGISYNSTTGVISYSGTVYTDSSIRALLSGGTGISYNSSTGAISYSGTVYTDSSVRALISLTTTGTSGASTYNNTTGVINVPNYTLAGLGGISLTSLSGGTGITYNSSTGAISYSGTVYTDASVRALLSAGTGISYNNTTGVITSTITQYTDALARASISITTTGTSGASTYNSTTGVLNVPQYAAALSGTNNYVAKFNSSSTIGNSVLYDNGTNLGIGTTSPSKMLSLYEGTSTTLHTIKMGNATSTTSGYLGMWYGQLRITNGSTYNTTSGWVADGASAPAQVYLNSASGASYITFDTANSNIAEPTERVRISSLGTLSINTTFGTSVYKLVTKVATDRNIAFGVQGGDVSIETFNDAVNANVPLRIYANPLYFQGGNIIIGATTDPGYKLYVSGTIYATGNITANSDLTLKKNLTIIDNATDKLMQLNGYSYQWKEDDSHQYGVIAQEVEKILPYAVSTGNDGIKGVSYNQIIPVLIEAVKEQKKELEELRNILASK